MLMARIRSIKQDWLEDEALAALPDSVRTLSVGLILLADDYGNGRGSVKFIASRVWAYTEDAGEAQAKAKAGLAELVRIGFIALYDVDGQAYFSILNWNKHQRVDKPGKPAVPSIPENAAGPQEKILEVHETPAPEEEEEEEGSGSRESAPEPPTPEPTVVRPRPIDRMAQSLTVAPKPVPGFVGQDDVATMFSELRVASRKGQYKNPANRDGDKLERVASEANDGGTDRASRLAALRECILGFLESEQRDRTYPIAFLANDPGGYRALYLEKHGGPAMQHRSPLEAAFAAAGRELQRAVKAQASAEEIYRLEQAEEAARKALAKSRSAA